MKKLTIEKIKHTGDIPNPRFGHTFTMVSNNKAVLFGGAISVNGIASII
jgi:predicted outer membrane repeat protein